MNCIIPQQNTFKVNVNADFLKQITLEHIINKKSYQSIIKRAIKRANKGYNFLLLKRKLKDDEIYALINSGFKVVDGGHAIYW